MTIKEFAKLCGCNAQTLRYYDRIDLLKPIKVDEWSGYRYYDKEQALTFVTIKNLQLAGFSIEEIKALISESNEIVYQAFEEKIKEQKEKLETIIRIQKSYQSEMKKMEEAVSQMQAKVKADLAQYDPEEEFGIDEADYREMMENVISTFDAWAAQGNYEDYNYEEYGDGDGEIEEQNTFFNHPDYELVYEKHGWNYAKEFIHDCVALPDSGDYNYVFHLVEEKKRSVAFPNIVLALVLVRNEKHPEKKRNLACSVSNSQDGKNHFWLFQKKRQ